jgi:hypothetical protein
MKRLSWLMTDSTNQTGVAVLCGEDYLPWKIAKPLFENQVEFNYLEESLFLKNSKQVNGKIIIENQSYQTVVIEESTKLESAVIDKLEMFIQSGGEVTVYINEHEASPIKGAKIIQQIENVVDELSVSHRNEVVISPSNKAIRVSKVTKSGKLFYFFVNEGEESYRGTFALKKESAIEKWSAWTGDIEQVGLIRQVDHLAAPLNIERRDSRVFIVDSDQKVTAQEQTTESVITEKLEMNMKWMIDGKRNRTLESWVNWDGMEYFSGTVIYQNQFLLDKTD